MEGQYVMLYVDVEDIIVDGIGCSSIEVKEDMKPINKYHDLEMDI